MTPVDDRVKKTPGRVRLRRLQRGSSEDFREGEVKKTPVEGRAKKAPEKVK
jgi:hypothetical protein